MAEENREKNEGGEEEESVKVFVGQIPKHMSESQLLTLFQEFAVVDEVNIIKDKITRASRGLFLILSVSLSMWFVEIYLNYFETLTFVLGHPRDLGCCFVICPSREEADKLVNACHNKKTLPGVCFFISSSGDLFC